MKKVNDTGTSPVTPTLVPLPDGCAACVIDRKTQDKYPRARMSANKETTPFNKTVGQTQAPVVANNVRRRAAVIGRKKRRSSRRNDRNSARKDRRGGRWFSAATRDRNRQ